MEPLKNNYNLTYYNKFLRSLTKVEPSFNKDAFLVSLFNKEWDQKELKERMRHTSICLNEHLDGDYAKQSNTLIKLCTQLIDDGHAIFSFEAMFLPDFIEQYGRAHFNTSMNALEEITKFTSCEFAIRPFIIDDLDQSLVYLEKWSKDDNEMVRRLASEGSRPRLPWAMALPRFKEDPSPIFPILNRMMNDPTELVRRSVANNLNDIAKDNPDLVIAWTKKRIGSSETTDRLLKHACRTLLKQGLSEVMPLFGFGSTKDLKVEQFTIKTPKVAVGERLKFQFKLLNKSKKDTLIRLEYGLHYLKANASLSKKVFKISEKVYPANSTTTIAREQSFKIISTRVFHKGIHGLSIIINGVEGEMLHFELI